MENLKTTRRAFLGATAATSVSMFHAGHISQFATEREKPRAKVERLGIASIGMRYQGTVISDKARLYGDIVSIADVDRHVREQARASFGSTPRIFEDYREMLDRKDIDVVLIGAPDHWHSKMLIDAVRAGKDVYCEKPLTLTIDEGKVLRELVGQSDRVVQVGTWQRSDSRFRLAVELVRQGRLGTLRKVTCTTDKNPTGGPFKTVPVPEQLNWDLWQGQTPDVPFIPERSHYNFRWWYEYAGGKMTDWGAHHVDIAQWAINSLPVEVDGKATFSNIKDSYNVATNFGATIKYANGVILSVADEGRRGILFEGDQGRIFVNRGSVSGIPVDDLKNSPLPRDEFSLYDFDNLKRPARAGKLDAIVNHMGNFFDCIESRRQPISDLESQHRSASTCHLANISMRLGRPLKWDPVREVFIGDEEANSFLKREQRKGFEVA
ncbi:MAG: myo-inositol 2-dehydrogenase/D-chiro-inositol 1-dehydrogenase [Mariniblastus sp.]|jgi:myo-inositol 2-dehydrogenase/D-chiro-inositol 1-dehydrogenase